MKLHFNVLAIVALLFAGCASPESYYNPPSRNEGNASIRGCGIKNKEAGTIGVDLTFIDGLIARGGTGFSAYKTIYPIAPGSHTVEFYIARSGWVGAPFTKRLSIDFEAQPNKDYQVQIELTDPETIKKPAPKATIWLVDIKTSEPVTQKIEFITEGVPHVMY